MIDAKPCVHCGCKRVEVEYLWGEYRVGCTRKVCGASGPIRKTKHGAIAAWNRRERSEKMQILSDDELRRMKKEAGFIPGSTKWILIDSHFLANAAIRARDAEIASLRELVNAFYPQEGGRE